LQQALIDTAVYSANAGRVHLSRVFVNRAEYRTISVVGNSLDMTKRSNPMRALLFAAGVAALATLAAIGRCATIIDTMLTAWRLRAA